MEPPTRILDPDARHNKVPLSFPNGTLKKHQLPRPPPQTADLLYRECLKNHAASLGGHALDGCGEFMPSPSANPADPTSIKCAACGCHRNFHRRLTEPHHHHQGEDDGQEGEGEGEDEMDGGEHMDNDDGGGDGRGEGERRRSSSSPPPYFSSAPHMLLALSTSLPGAPGPVPTRPIAPAVGPGTVVGPTPGAAAVLPRKRFRSKFSPEQKGRMQELSERLGWRMQKRDEGLVEECCREIGVGKGVFKVWMHNNKHNFVPGSSRRGEVGGSSSSSGAVGINCDGVGVAVASASASAGAGAGAGGLEANGSGGAGNTHVVNGSSSSS